MSFLGMLGKAFRYYKNNTFLALRYFKIRWDNYKQILKKCTESIQKTGPKPYPRRPRRKVPLVLCRPSALKGSQDAPRRSPRGLKTAQEAPGRPPRGPRTFPKRLQDEPLEAPRRPKRPQDSPQEAPRGTRAIPGEPQGAPRRPKTSPKKF